MEGGIYKENYFTMMFDLLRMTLLRITEFNQINWTIYNGDTHSDGYNSFENLG